ncbi:MAG: hypothetical protein EBS96_03305 [Spartobacteria bacterium]|nr:hypothetical protein [Spartobacteria bacterium]
MSFPVSANTTVDWRTAIANSISTYSYQRLCPLIKTSIAASANLTANPNTICWTVNASTANHTFGNVTSGSNITTTNSTEQWNHADANPNFDSGNAIPSDPSFNNRNGNAIFANATLTNGTWTFPNPNDMRIPELPSFSGNYFYTSPADLGLVPTNQRWRRLRMQMQPSSEGSLIPDWAMLDVISFGNSTNASLPHNRLQPVNVNGKFHLPGNATIAPRTIGIQALAKVLELSSNGTIQNPIDVAQSANLTSPNDVTRFKGATANATTIANAIGSMTWTANSTWDTRRNTLRFPADQYILPSEIMEIAGVADAVSQTDYNNSSSHFKRNEGRASALIPAVTTRSSFFTIYAYAQAGKEINGTFVPDSEALTKTLVEVEIATTANATTQAQYKVKKLYTQPIPMGE